MSDFSLIDYLKKNKVIDDDLLDSLYYNLCSLVYYYGEQFKYPREKTKQHKKHLIGRLKHTLLKYIIRFYLLKNKNRLKNEPKIISNSYFSVNSELIKLGFNVYKPIWEPSYQEKICGNISLLKKTEYIKKYLLKKNFNEIISQSFIEFVHSYRKKIIDFYRSQNILALIVPNDLSFFENLTIKVFQELKKPTFIFLHGIPLRYNLIDDNQSDYLIVWGEGIKNEYVKAGYSENKIYVGGHPSYKKISYTKLKFNFDNILVLTKSMPGSQLSDFIRLFDRGNLIVYLLKIQKVLKKLGVKSVRLRPHPSERISWYWQFIDKKFFRADNNPLDESLKKSTLVIGPSSTVFIETLYYRVNYVIFEPSNYDKDIFNYKLVPPFDGTYDEIPVAKNEEDLYNILKDKIEVDPYIIKNYIKTPFDISFIRDLL